MPGSPSDSNTCAGVLTSMYPLWCHCHLLPGPQALTFGCTDATSVFLLHADLFLGHVGILETVWSCPPPRKKITIWHQRTQVTPTTHLRASRLLVRALDSLSFCILSSAIPPSLPNGVPVSLFSVETLPMSQIQHAVREVCH